MWTVHGVAPEMRSIFIQGINLTAIEMNWRRTRFCYDWHHSSSFESINRRCYSYKQCGHTCRCNSHNQFWKGKCEQESVNKKV
jgi:hypothetical protein